MRFNVLLCSGMIFIAANASAADATTFKHAQMFVPASTVTHFPEVGVENEAEIGKTMVSRLNQHSFSAVELTTDATFEIKASFFDNNWSGKATIHKGVLKQYAETTDGVFYLDEQAKFRIPVGNMPQLGGLYVPADKARPAVLWTLYKANKIVYGTEPIPYTTKTVSDWTKDRMTKELVYGGVSQGTVSINYREFVNNTARPAFSQDLKYDLAAGDEIGFRGLRFKIIKAGNVSIKYIVTQALE